MAFDRSGGFGGGRSRGDGHGRSGGFSGGRSGDFNRGPREMHDATCSSCGVQTQVPFKPTEGRELFCKDCYMKKKNSGA